MGEQIPLSKIFLVGEMMNKFGLTDTNLESIKTEIDRITFYGNLVKDFNEEELKIAVVLLARMIRYEQKRLFSQNSFTQLTLETVDFKFDD